MKTETVKQMSYGRSCGTCRLYFVTTDPSAYTCPWCLRQDKGGDLLDAYEQVNNPDSDIRMVGRVEA